MKKERNDLADMAMELGRMVRKAIATEGAKEESPILMHGLSFIAEKPGMTMTAFAASMQTSPSTATMFVNKLAKAGLVARAADKDNRRSVLLRLTPKGARTVAKHRRMKQAAFAKVFAALSPADRKTLERIFSLLTSTDDSHD